MWRKVLFAFRSIDNHIPYTSTNADMNGQTEPHTLIDNASYWRWQELACILQPILINQATMLTRCRCRQPKWKNATNQKVFTESLLSQKGRTLAAKGCGANSTQHPHDCCQAVVIKKNGRHARVQRNVFGSVFLQIPDGISVEVIQTGHRNEFASLRQQQQQLVDSCLWINSLVN